MLKIFPVQDKSEQERICGLCETEYLPDALAYAGYENDVLSCIAQFSIKNGYAKLFCLSPAAGAPENRQVMMLCGRAALNFAYTIGIERACCEIPADDRIPLYKETGFSVEDGKMKCDLKQLFESCCC